MRIQEKLMLRRRFVNAMHRTRARPRYLSQIAGTNFGVIIYHTRRRMAPHFQSTLGYRPRVALK